MALFISPWRPSTAEAMNLRTVLTVTFLGHLLNHSLTLIYPVVMIQLLELFPGTSLTTLGLLGTGHYLLYGLGAFPAGWLTDRFGARTLLLTYLVGSGFAVAILVLSTGLVQLAVGLALLGLSCSLYHPAGLTLISHSSPRLSRHLGLHGIAGSFGLALGPLGGGALAGWLGWQAPYVLFGSLAVLTGIYLWRATDSGRQQAPAPESQAARPTRIGPLISVYIIGIFMGLARQGTLSFLPLHFSQHFSGRLAPVMVGGLLTALVLASGILGQLLGGLLGDRFDRNRILLFVVALNIPLLYLMSTLTPYPMLGVAILWSVVNFSYQPVANALVADYSDPRRRGTLFGVFIGLSFGVGSLASTLAGTIADRWDTAAIFLVMGLLLLPAVLAGLFLRRHAAGEGS